MYIPHLISLLLSVIRSKYICTENEHAVQCANDLITVINETIKQRILTSPNIKDFSIEWNIDGINKGTECIVQLDGTNTKRERSDNKKKNVFSITLPSLFGLLNIYPLDIVSL